MRRIAIAGMAAGVIAGALSAPADARVGCRSGRTVFKRPGVRVFSIRRARGDPHDGRSHYKLFFVCANATRAPILFNVGQPFNIESVSDFKIYGDRLGYVVGDQGIQSGASVSIGWVRLPHGPVKEGPIWATEDLSEEQELEEHVPKVPAEELEYAIARDGTVAVAGEAHAATAGVPLEWEVCELTVTGHGLSRPKVLFGTTSRGEAPVLRTIAINGSTVSWRNASGSVVSVSR
jgi:hypothetical protein